MPAISPAPLKLPDVVGATLRPEIFELALVEAGALSVPETRPTEPTLLFAGVTEGLKITPACEPAIVIEPSTSRMPSGDESPIPSRSAKHPRTTLQSCPCLRTVQSRR